jgi:hypothetical protein
VIFSPSCLVQGWKPRGNGGFGAVTAERAVWNRRGDAQDDGDFNDSFGESMTSPDARAGGGPGVSVCRGEVLAVPDREFAQGTRVLNQRFDEAHELSGDSGFEESIDTHAQSMSMTSPVGGGVRPGGGRRGAERGDTPPRHTDDGEHSGYPSDDMEMAASDRARAGAARPAVRGRMGDGSSEEEDEEEEEEEDEETTEEDEMSGAGVTTHLAASKGLAPSSVASAAAASSGPSTVTLPRGYDSSKYAHLKVTPVSGSMV